MNDVDLKSRIFALAEMINDTRDGIECDLFDVEHDGHTLELRHLGDALGGVLKIQTELDSIVEALGWKRATTTPHLRVVPKDDDEIPF